MALEDSRVPRLTNDTRSPRVAAAALVCLETHIRPMVIVDEELRLLWSNHLASDLLRRHEEIEERSGFLTLEDPDQQARLSRLLKLSGSDLTTFCLPLSGGTGHLLIRARRVECEDAALFALQVTRTDSDDHDIYRDLDVAFGLTASEHRVLLSLLRGNDAETLTHLLGVSMDTVRTHIRNIYVKLDVNSRERLFAKVQPFRI